MKKLSIDEYILLNYKNKTNAEMAEEMNCCKSTISRHRKKFGISFTDRNKELRSKVEYICSLQGKRTKSQIAKELNCSVSFVDKIWRENKLPTHGGMIYFLNDNYFNDINTPEKAYWLGFIAADGCVYLRDGRQGILSIGISTKDIEILENFKRQLNTEKSISISKDKRRDSEIATLQLTSDILCNKLIDIGIGIRKTFDLSIKQILENIPKKFHASFILGYFDGDGSIDNPKDGTISKGHIRIVGPLTNLIDFKQCLENNFIYCQIHKDNKKYSEPFGSLEFTSTIQKYNFLKFIYSFNIFSLTRKKERSYELIRRIENNITNRSENIKAIENYRSVVVKREELLES